MTGAHLLLLMSLVPPVDPFQAYEFDCNLRRPGGQTLAVQGSIKGKDAATRSAFLSVGLDKPMSGRRYPITVHTSGSNVVDREVFHVERGDLRYSFIFDRSWPFENKTIGLTIMGIEITAADPVRLSALGFCRLQDILEEGMAR